MISSYSITFLKFIKWLLLPSNLVLRKLIPVLYALLLQVVTGIPKPDALEKFDVTAFTIKFSEKIHDYPYWLQDLSHLPLFFIFTWLAHWFFTPNDGHNSVKVKAVSTSIFYAIFNEGIQAIIPDRFPSPGDLFMNLAGVITAAIIYIYLEKKMSKTMFH